MCGHLYIVYNKNLFTFKNIIYLQFLIYFIIYFIENLVNASNPFLPKTINSFDFNMDIRFI